MGDILPLLWLTKCQHPDNISVSPFKGRGTFTGLNSAFLRAYYSVGHGSTRTNRPQEPKNLKIQRDGRIYSVNLQNIFQIFFFTWQL